MKMTVEKRKNIEFWIKTDLFMLKSSKTNLRFILKNKLVNPLKTNIWNNTQVTIHEQVQDMLYLYVSEYCERSFQF